MKKDFLGQFEQLVLMAVVALGDDAYGAAVHEKSMDLGARTVAFGSVHVTLERLQDKGYIASKSGPPPEMGGKARRYYRLRATGRQALREALRTSQRLQQTAEAMDFR